MPLPDFDCFLNLCSDTEDTTATQPCCMQTNDNNATNQTRQLSRKQWQKGPAGVSK